MLQNEKRILKNECKRKIKRNNKCVCVNNCVFGFGDVQKRGLTSFLRGPKVRK